MQKSFMVHLVQVTQVKVVKWVTLDGPADTDWEAEARKVARMGGTDSDNVVTASGIVEKRDLGVQEVVVDLVTEIDVASSMELLEPQWVVTCPMCDEMGISVKGIDGEPVTCLCCGFKFKTSD
jgi:hypothetical protein